MTRTIRRRRRRRRQRRRQQQQQRIRQQLSRQKDKKYNKDDDDNNDDNDDNDDDDDDNDDDDNDEKDRAFHRNEKSTLLFDCHVRTWRVAELNRMQWFVDRAYRYVWKRGNDAEGEEEHGRRPAGVEGNVDSVEGRNQSPKGIIWSAVPLPCLFAIVKYQGMAVQWPY